jgi:hypothetical protein
MDGRTIFLLIWFVVAIYILTTLYRKGKKAIQLFPSIKTVKVKYRDKRASGYSMKSWLTKMGGANNALDIIVTDSELWIRSNLIFAYFAQYYDLLHKIPLTDITEINRNRKTITVDFNTSTGEHKQVVLKTKNPTELLHSINLKKTTPNN